MARPTIGNRVRALYLQPAPLFGGAERQAVASAAFLPEFGVDVVPMVGPGHVITEWMQKYDVRKVAYTRCFPGSWAKQNGLKRITLPYRYLQCGFQARRQVAELVQDRDIDVILASLPFAWITGELVAREFGIPIVWRAGGVGVNRVQRTALRMLTTFLRPDLLLCNGEAVRDRFSPLVRAPVAIVPNGVDFDIFHPGAGNPLRYRSSNARQVVGYAARLADSKRPQDFIELAAHLRGTYPTAEFLIAGEGSLRAHYERMARELGANNVRFLGFVADMPSFYAGCDVLVLPSRSEGCSNFMLEAMAMRRPIVATDIAPTIELAGASERALVYKLRDVGELSERVSLLLSRPEMCEALTARAFAYVSKLTARDSAAQIATILRALVSERAARRYPLRAAPQRTATNGQRAAAE